MEAASVSTPEHQQPAYDWAFPGAPVRVHLRLDVIQRLRAHLAQESQSTAGEPPARRGLLLGGVSAIGAEIVDFLPLSSVEAGEVLAAAAQFESSGDGVRTVGYYRTRGEEKLCLDPEDLILAQDCFPDPNCVFLVISQTAAGPGNAGFFFWDNQHIDGDFCFLEFPFDAHLLAEMKLDEARRHLQTPVELLRDLIPACNADGNQRVRRLGRAGWFMVAAVLFGVGGFGGTFFAQRLISVLRAGVTNAPSVAHATVAHASSISLRAERQGTDLAVSWNRASSIVASAQTGELTIEDGAIRKSVLDRTTLRSGSVLYTPVTDQVRIELEIAASGQRSISESVLVLLNRQNGGGQITPLSKRQEPRSLKPVSVSDQSGAVDLQTSQALALSPKKVFQLPTEKARELQPVDMIPSAPFIAAKDSASILGPGLLLLPKPAQPGQLLRLTPTGHTDLSTPPRPVVLPTAAAGAAFTPPVALRAIPPPRLTPMQRAFVTRPELVKIKVYVDAKGNVHNAEAITKASPILVSAALSTVWLWQFRPARRGGQPVPGELILEFNFDPAK